jgi:imidazolonepropionase
VIEADCVVAGCRELLTCRGPVPKRREALRDIGLIKDAWIAARDGRIVFLGPADAFAREVTLEAGGLRIDGEGLVGLPGFVDSHTHLPFAGTREKEFALRLQGWTYQRLAAEGMGIRSTVRATRAIGKKELIEACLRRLDEMLLSGTTTVEAKSGYGLNLKDEVKQLEAVREAAEVHPATVVPTFMGAHEVPDEYRGRKEEYLDLLVRSVLPAVRDRGLARFVDVFCEQDVFSVEETERLVAAARSAGFGVKIHADEFAALGGAELAARVGAVSADHLIAVTDAGIRALAGSETAATLLPNVPFFLMQEKKAPARRLIDGGAAVAIASDFNPGSSMTSNMQFVVQLAVYTLRMGIEEAINAATANAAFALRVQDEAGSLEVGKRLDLVLYDVPSYAFLVYRLGANPVKHVLKDGKAVVRDGRLVRPSR